MRGVENRRWSNFRGDRWSRIHADGIRSAIVDRISQRKKMCSRHLRPQIAASALPIWCAKMSQGKKCALKSSGNPVFGHKKPAKARKLDFARMG